MSKYVTIGYIKETKDGRTCLYIEGPYDPETKSNRPISIAAGTYVNIVDLNEEEEAARKRGMSEEICAKIRARVQKTPEWKRQTLVLKVD